MRYKQLIGGAFLLWTCIAYSNRKKQVATVVEVPPTSWDNCYVGRIDSESLSPEAKGSAIYATVIPDPETYIIKHAHEAAEMLYFTPEDSVSGIEEIHYASKECDGVSTRDGVPPSISTVYSTKWIEKSFANNDTAKVDYETHGVLYHELTHGFQLEPQGIGNYGINKALWVMVEGAADAVRHLNDDSTLEDRPKSGHYTNGYHTTGSPLAWLMQTKNPDLLRKFNQSISEVIPWLFNGGMRYALGNDYDVDSLWEGYMTTMGDGA